MPRLCSSSNAFLRNPRPARFPALFGDCRKMAAALLYCVCRQPYDVSRFMIECDICKDWFHGSCVQVEEHHAVDIDQYHCPSCDVLHGPSLMKKRNNWHRHDYTEAEDGSKPVQAGTSVFVRELQARSFPSADEIILKMQGSQVTQKYLEKQGFESPIMVPTLDGIGLKLPPPSFSVKDVEHYVGGNKVIDVIDVARQADSKIKLCDFVEYYYKPYRPKVLNVISLEFSDTKMADLVVVPDIAQKMSWVENYWPDDSFFPKPFVQKYCLMGVKDSYTDFHIDFGGTSVWYHVLWGEKIFYLIKPTKTNLALYEAWSSSPDQSEVFFGEKVEKCYKCVVQQGTTLFIPTGWIHAVLTSQDCMAFGGNFLHNLNIGMQLRCYEMERRLKTPDLFKFPYFEAICWYVAKNLLETLKELREDSCQPPDYLLEGVKALTTALKSWLKREVTEPATEVPDHIRPGNLIKELSKEIRYQEEEHGGSKPMKTQGMGSSCPVTRSTLERGSSSQARRNARRLRDHGSKAPSNLDILELHTREVLRRLEMAPWEEDAVYSANLNSRFNKIFQPVSTVPEWRIHDNNIRLVLSNGQIVRDKRQPVTEKSLFTGNSDDDRGISMETKKVKSEKECWGEESEQERTRESDTEQKPLNMFFESVKSELRNGASGHSDMSDSETESEHSCATKNCSSEEESGSLEEDGEKETSSKRETQRGSGGIMDLYQASQRLTDQEKPLKRELPTSPSTEEDAIQGMLSMAGFLYPQCLPSQTEGTLSSQEPWDSREQWWWNPSTRIPDSGIPSREEPVYKDESQENALGAAAPRLDHQDEMKVQKHIRKECTAELSQRIQENKNFMDSQSSSSSSSSSSDSWVNHRLSLSKFPPTFSPLRDDDSPEFQYSETSLSPPLHPSKRPASNPPPVSNQATKGKRPKKGMATAKQRLGKILKLNRHRSFFV
ncbi:lysine-specific demethylase 7B-like isoform X2 [Acipenser ruthenus]|uniref:lysine-specific demethylase 7B-like isoform X2 n=1 Tax=Acipenser ruthenus TaxID=7906 RepID=UPI002740BACB|nr:lysine-specific demethylase 7B-like isoform X2 [Acipenser ruthenus]